MDGLTVEMKKEKMRRGEIKMEIGKLGKLQKNKVTGKKKNKDSKREKKLGDLIPSPSSVSSSF